MELARISHRLPAATADRSRILRCVRSAASTYCRVRLRRPHAPCLRGISAVSRRQPVRKCRLKFSTLSRRPSSDTCKNYDRLTGLFTNLVDRLGDAGGTTERISGGVSVEFHQNLAQSRKGNLHRPAIRSRTHQYRRKCSREFTIDENEVLVLVRSAHSVEIGRRTNDGNAMTISKRRTHEPPCRCYRTFFGSAGASRQRLADRRNLVLIYVRRVRQRHTPPIHRFRLRIEPNTRGGDLGKHCGGDHKAEQQSGAEGAHIDLYAMNITA